MTSAAFPEVRKLERLQTAKVTFKVTQGIDVGAIRYATYDFVLVVTARAVYAVVVSLVCPSVNPSVTSRHCTKKAKGRNPQTTPYYSLGTLVF